VGPDWEAGSIALYLSGHPPVLPDADFHQAPWIDRDLISRCGALVIGRVGQPLELQLAPLRGADLTDRTVLQARDRVMRESEVQAAVIAPAAGQSCP
jgi:hypothetical protein